MRIFRVRLSHMAEVVVPIGKEEAGSHRRGSPSWNELHSIGGGFKCFRCVTDKGDRGGAVFGRFSSPGFAGGSTTPAPAPAPAPPKVGLAGVGMDSQSSSSRYL